MPLSQQPDRRANPSSRGLPSASAPGPPPEKEGPVTPANFGRKCLEFRFRFREWTVIFFSYLRTNFYSHGNSDSFKLTFPGYLNIVTKMASSPQKSPSSPKSPTPKSPSSRKKDDSFLGKLGGTLARRKKAKEGKRQKLAKQRTKK